MKESQRRGLKWAIKAELEKCQRPRTSMQIRKLFPKHPSSSVSSALSTLGQTKQINVNKEYIPHIYTAALKEKPQDVEVNGCPYCGSIGNNGITIDQVFDYVDRKNKEMEEMKRQLDAIKTRISQGRDFGDLMKY